MKDTLRHISEVGILPIITIEETLDAIPIAQALYDGGIPMVVITFRNDNGPECIELITKAIPDMLVGAGTVLSTAQVDQAIAAGAKFFTSPAINPTVVNYCKQKNIPIFPGAATPNNIEEALTLGLEHIEYFPAEANGGVEGLRAVSAPYPKVNFIALGGVNNDNMVHYLNDPKIFAVAGDWFIKEDWIRFKDYEMIEQSAQEAVKIMLDFEIDHIGLNFPKEESALYAAEEFGELFGYDVKKTAEDTGFFAGSYFETMKPGYMGTVGHIAINTNSVERAKAYLERKGLGFIDEKTECMDDGSLRLVVLDKEIGGFAIQLIRKDAVKGRGELVYSGMHPHSLDLQIEELLNLTNIDDSIGE